MTLIPRVLLSLLISAGICLGIIHFMAIPPESYLPPPNLYDRATATAQGYVTGTHASGFGDHLLEGSGTFYDVYYKFQTYVRTIKPDGKSIWTKDPTWYTGTVRVAAQTFSKVQTNEPVTVKYDPLDANINGVPGTLGVWSTRTGYLNPYLWWYIVILIATLAIQELIRMATRTSDYR